MGYVIGRIREYQASMLILANRSEYDDDLFKGEEPVEHDIQEELGERDEEHHCYNVYLSVKGLAHYKYRMMFVRYGTFLYPVTIIMNDELAIEYSGNKNGIYQISSVDELENMMDVVINSEIMVSLIQKLINEALRL